MPVYPLTAWKPSCTSPGCWCRDRVPRYPSDLDDAQWAVLEPQARAVMAELAITAGRPMVHDLRAMCDAVFYVVRNGIEWRALPADFPPWEAVYAFYQRWSARGLPQTLVHRLLDAFGTLKIMWADSGYDGAPLAAWIKAVAGITLEVVRRCDPHAFQIVRRRWVVERTFGWLMRYRRLARDYERLTAHHEAMVYWATIMIMTRRLARYQANQPPQQRWGGDRPQPAAA